jgi:hypothetical protein
MNGTQQAKNRLVAISLAEGLFCQRSNRDGIFYIGTSDDLIAAGVVDPKDNMSEKDTSKDVEEKVDSPPPRRRYDILLPVCFNDNSKVPCTLFNEVRNELSGKFGGLSEDFQLISGSWMNASGNVCKDELRRFSVDVEDTAENRDFFLTYKDTLEKRFSQEELYITSHLISVVSL